jgi:hypothetical protein
MKLNIKAGAIAATASMIAIPAAALAGPPANHGNGNGHHPHKCMPHSVAYIEGGTVTATTETNGAVTGITLDVKHANRMAKADPTTTLTLSDVRTVRYAGGTSAPAVGDRVQILGRIEVTGKKCPAAGSTSPTFGMLVVHPAG